MIKKVFAILLSATLLVSSISFADQSYTAGTYTASADGNNGPVTVEVTFSESAIETVTVVEHNETAGICDAAIETIPRKIVEEQTLAIDAVTGATNSSNAILNAVADCVVQANGDVDSLKEKADPAEDGRQAERLPLPSRD